MVILIYNCSMRLYSITGKVESPDLANFPEIPADESVLALKYADPVDGAQWITDLDELREMRSANAPLSYTREGIAALGDPFDSAAAIE